MREWGFDIARGDAVPRTVRRAAADRRDRAGAGPRRQVRAARRAHRRPGAPGRPAAVRAGPPAHRGRRGRPLHLAPPGRGLRDLPGRRGAARRRAGADRARPPTSAGTTWSRRWSAAPGRGQASQDGGRSRETARAGPRRRGAGRGRPHRGLGPRPPVRRVAAGARRGGRGRHRPAQRGRRHPRPRHRRRGRPCRRRGPAARAPRPARRRAAAQRAGHRLHPGGPPRRGVRRAPGRGRERHDDHHQAAVRPARRAAARAAGPPRRRRSPPGCRWCRPVPASRSASCPAATSRRSPSRGRSRTPRRSSSRSRRPAASTSRRRNCCSARSPTWRRAAAAGVLLCSDELSDLAICDRVIVLVRGEVFTEFTKPPFDRDELIVATEGMTGHDGRRGDPPTARRQRMISNQAPREAPAAAPAGGGGAAAAAAAWLRVRGMNVGVLREVALLPVLVLLIVVGTVVSPAFFTVVELRRHRPAELRARRGRGRREPDPADRRHGPVARVDLRPGADGRGLADRAGRRVRRRHRPQPLPRHRRAARGRRRGRPHQRAADREGQAERVHRDPRHDDRARGPAERHRQGPVAVQPARSPSATWAPRPSARCRSRSSSPSIIFVLVGLFLRYHRTGRAIYAVGGNTAAARAAGIKVERIKIGVYVAGSVLAAIGGLMEAGRVSAVTGQQGYGRASSSRCSPPR